MDQFIQKYCGDIQGTLSGFDRVLFKGSLRRLCFADGITYLMHTADVLLKEFKSFVDEISKRVRVASMAECQRLGRPNIYLPSSATSKEATASEIAKRDNIRDGLICVIQCVELCHSFSLNSNKQTKRLQIDNCPRKCLHIYHYYMHPVFGFMHARLQTWLPLGIQVCINGREWLSRQMDQEGIGYVRQDNCFPWIENFPRAQELMNEQLRADFPGLLAEIAGALNPDHEEMFSNCPTDYYWSTRESEWATDIGFSRSDSLKRLYPLLIQHGLTTLSSPDVMRFLGKANPDRTIRGNFQGEVVSDVKRRVEGVRIKHSMESNSVKMYDKAYTVAGSVLRVETTINNAAGFRVERTVANDPSGEIEVRQLRRGVIDIALRAGVSQQSNNRYMDALTSVDSTERMQELLSTVTAPTDWCGKRVRAINPFEKADVQLLEAVSRAEFTINGLRNRDLQRLFFEGEATTKEESRRRSARVTRQIRMLRAHRILEKIEGTHRYQLTPSGRKLTTAVLTARRTPVHQLVPADLLKEAA